MDATDDLKQRSDAGREGEALGDGAPPSDKGANDAPLSDEEKAGEEVGADVSAAEPERGPHEAPPNRWFNGKWIFFSILLLGGGLYFLYDGLVGYPAHNAEIAEVERQAEEAKFAGDLDRETELLQQRRGMGDVHSDNDIRLQVLLGVVLPIGGLALLGWTLRSARGRLRLDEHDVLHVPGHPPVPLTAITDIDDDRWDKKGVSRLAYEHEGHAGVIKLDDFIYDRPPTDAIHDRAVWVWRKGKNSSETTEEGGAGA